MAKSVKKVLNRKAEIINTARNLFNTKDYEKTTMQDVMEALDIAKGTIYHYFKSKEDLLEAVIEDIVDRVVGQIQSIMKESKGNALQKMKLLIQAGNVSQENKNIVEHLHKSSNYAMHSRLLAATTIKLAPIYAELIEQGCKEGIFKTSAPLECAEFILSGVQFLTDVGIYPWTKQDLNRRIKAFPKLLEQLLQAKPGSFKFIEEALAQAN